MGLKKVLHLESCSLTDEQIMFKLAEAQRKNMREVEFSTPERIVRVKVRGVDPAGIMRGYIHPPAR